MNVHAGVYGNVELFDRMVSSVPDEFTVHVFDGRYQSFGTDLMPDVTPGLEEYCDDSEQCIYHEPPTTPFKRRDDVDAKARSSVWKKAKWIFETLPQDEWTVKLDDDELLGTISDDQIQRFREDWKYAPLVNLRGTYNAAGRETVNGIRADLDRIFKPKYWTPWLDDVFFPRDLYPRDTPLETLWNLACTTDARYTRWSQTDAVYIENRGNERDSSTLQHRVEQLRMFGNTDRADEIEDSIRRKHD